MSKYSLARLVSWGIATACGVALISCSTTESPKRGELVLALQTNMDIPKDVDTVGLSIASNGNMLFRQEYSVTDGQTSIPATLGIMAGADASIPVQIRVWARAGGHIKTLRSVVTTVPQERVALLSVPIEWLCEDKTEETDGVIRSTCAGGKTCVGGGCVKETKEPTTLPDYAPEAVYHGATPEEGMCFDMNTCFQDATRLTINPFDPNTWKVNIPNLQWGRLNLALELPPGSVGTCDSQRCLLMLDYDPETGWQTASDALKFAPGIIDKVKEGKVLSLMATDKCPRKTLGIPLCGPYSSVTTPMLPDGGRGTPIDAAAPPTDGGHQEAGDPLACNRPDDVTSDKGYVCFNLNWEKMKTDKSDPDLDGNVDIFLGLFKKSAFSMTLGPVESLDTRVLAEPAKYVPLKGQLIDDKHNTPQVAFDADPGDYYVWAVAYDNAAEEDLLKGSLSNVSKGGAWVGGVKLLDPYGAPLGLRSVNELVTKVHVEAGGAVSVPVEMMALRRLTVNVDGPDKGVLGHPGDPRFGWLTWRTYDRASITKENLGPTGWALSDCMDVPIGSAQVPLTGFVIGKGRHYIVGMFDGYDAIAMGNPSARRENLVNSPVRAFDGGVYSGYAPSDSSPPGSWTSDAHVDFAPDQYSATSTITVQSFQSPGGGFSATDQCP